MSTLPSSAVPESFTISHACAGRARRVERGAVRSRESSSSVGRVRENGTPERVAIGESFEAHPFGGGVLSMDSTCPPAVGDKRFVNRPDARSRTAWDLRSGTFVRE